MGIEIVILPPVQDFIYSLDKNAQLETHRVIGLLSKYGHKLLMPFAKPIGSGLWELIRLRNENRIRILYGFCHSKAVLVLGFRKQKPAIFPRDFRIARKRLREYCG